MKNSALAQAAAVSALLRSSASVDSLEALSAVVAACCADLMTCGEFARTAELAAELKQTCDPPSQARPWIAVALMRLRALLMLDRKEEARVELAALRDILAPLIPKFPEEWAQFRCFEASLLWRTNRFADSLAILDEVERELRAKPVGLVIAVWGLEKYALCALLGDLESARAAALDAYVASKWIGDNYRRAISQCYLGIVERRLCNWNSAREYVDSAEAWMRSVGNGHFTRICVNSRAIVDWKQGRLEESLAGATSLLVEATSNNATPVCTTAELIRVVTLAQKGRFGEALEAIARLEMLTAREPLSRPSILLHEYFGDLLLQQGEKAAAREQFDAALKTAEAVSPAGDVVAELTVRVVETRLGNGQATPLAPIVEEAIATLRRSRERYEEAACYRVLAMAYAESGQMDAAARAFEDGFAVFDEVATPYEWGKLWLAYGDWLAAKSSAAHRNLSTAREAYVAARDHFERIGAEYVLGLAWQRIESLDETMRAEGEVYASGTSRVRPLRRPRRSAELLRRAQWAYDNFDLLTRNEAVIEILQEVGRLATSDLSVLILGESGTGKELVAKGLHRLSGRTGDLIAVNCSAVPEAMLEGEFFGYMKGAFTNAVADKPGLLEVAHTGTVFLDEIGEMSSDLQAKLLRFLESGLLRRIGATREQAIDARIVAATNRDRAALQSGNGFRSDLYYRLAHAVYILPPLRARGDDIELLVDHFLGVHNLKEGKHTRFGPAAMSRLVNYAWPGNVRELQAVVHKLVVAATPAAVFTPRDLAILDESDTGSDFISETNANEKRRIVAALEQARWVKTEAAQLLRISRTTLLSKMKRLGVEG